MSATLREIKIVVTVNDMEQLPEGWSDDDVVEDLAVTLEQAAVKWYNGRGINYLACPPDIV